MLSQEIDELMEKRKFRLLSKDGVGIRRYTFSDATKTPKIVVLILPEREEFRLIYENEHSSVLTIATPWCRSIYDREYFKNMLNQIRKWARKIEELYEE